jgi:hypothetical protein
MIPNNIRRSMLPALAALLVSSALTACYYTGRDRDAAPQYSSHQSYEYEYYYYPRADVYYHPYSGRYYYREGSSWRNATSLPRNIHVDGRERKLVAVRGSEPYRHNQEHRNTYKPSGEDRHGQARRDDDEKWDKDERQHNSQRHQEYQKPTSGRAPTTNREEEDNPSRLRGEGRYER